MLPCPLATQAGGRQSKCHLPLKLLSDEEQRGAVVSGSGNSYNLSYVTTTLMSSCTENRQRARGREGTRVVFRTPGDVTALN